MIELESEVGMMTHTPQILIDEPEDGYIQHTAWVEVNTETTPEKAIELIEKDWPTEDREEEERYVCDGQEWLKPDPNDEWITGEFEPWVSAEEGEDHARLFYVIKVVCAA